MDAQAGVRQPTYRITVRGLLDENWSNWLSGMSIAVERTDEGMPLTMITGPVVDQSALRGVLNRLWDLNLTLISVNRVVAEKE